MGADEKRTAIRNRDTTDLERTQSNDGVGTVIVDDGERSAVERNVSKCQIKVPIVQCNSTSNVELIVLRAERGAVEFDIEVRAAGETDIAGVQDSWACAGSNSPATLHRDWRSGSGPFERTTSRYHDRPGDRAENVHSARQRGNSSTGRVEVNAAVYGNASRRLKNEIRGGRTCDCSTDRNRTTVRRSNFQRSCGDTIKVGVRQIKRPSSCGAQCDRSTWGHVVENVGDLSCRENVIIDTYAIEKSTLFLFCI